MEQARSYAFLVASFSIAALGLSACGGASSPASLTVGQSQADAAPVLVPVSVNITVPRGSNAQGRAPKYVATTTNTLTLSVNGGALTSASCPVTCSIVAQVPVGTDSFSVATLGTSAQVLSSGSTTQAITQSGPNNVSVLLNPVVASVVLSLGTSSTLAGSSLTTPVTVTAKDADGNTITGPGSYVTPIQISNSSSTGNVTLSASSVSAPGATINVAYNGVATPEVATLTPSVVGVSPAAMTPTALKVVNVALVPNGDMSSPAQTVNTHAFPQLPSGWSAVGPYSTDVYNGNDSAGDVVLPAGKQGSLFQNTGTGIGQTLSGLTSGGVYQIRLDAAGAGAGAVVSVTANAVTVLNTAVTNGAYATFTTTSFTAPGSTDAITIIDNSVAGNLDVTNVYLIGPF